MPPVITIESVTDTPEQVTATLDVANKPPVTPPAQPITNVVDEQVSKPATTDAPAVNPDGTPVEQTGEPTTEETEEAPEPKIEVKKKGGFQKKIDRLELQLENERAEAAKLRNQLDKKSGTDTSTTVAIPGLGPEPKLSDFKDKEDPYAELALASGRYFAKKERLEEKAEREQAELQRKHMEVTRSYTKRLDQVESTIYPDFAEVTEALNDPSSGVTISPVMQYAIQHSNIAPDIQYYLCQHPERSKEIAETEGPDVLIAMGELIVEVRAEIKRLESKAKKGADKVTDPPSTESTKPPVAKPAKTVSTAPKPISPSGSKSTNAVQDLESLAAAGDFKAYQALRQQQGFRYK